MKRFSEFRRGDRLCVLTGKNKGKIGRFVRLIPKKKMIILEGVNMVIRHTKPETGSNEPGGRKEKEAPLHISNVALMCPNCATPTRLAHEIIVPQEAAADGQKPKAKSVRVCKRCQARIDEYGSR